MSAWRFTNALVLLLGASGGVAAEPLDRSTPAPTNILINSQTLIYRSKDNTAVFEGEVVMTKGVFVMHADRMIVYFDATAAPSLPTSDGKTAAPATATTSELPTFGNRSVSMIDATGNVVMQQGAKKAKSQKAVYHQHDEKLVLTGDPEAWETGYRVTGSKITMFVREDRSIVENSRVVITDTESKPPGRQ